MCRARAPCGACRPRPSLRMRWRWSGSGWGTGGWGLQGKGHEGGRQAGAAARALVWGGSAADLCEDVAWADRRREGGLEVFREVRHAHSTPSFMGYIPPSLRTTAGVGGASRPCSWPAPTSAQPLLRPATSRASASLLPPSHRLRPSHSHHQHSRPSQPAPPPSSAAQHPATSPVSLRQAAVPPLLQPGSLCLPHTPPSQPAPPTLPSRHYAPLTCWPQGQAAASLLVEAWAQRCSQQRLAALQRWGRGRKDHQGQG